MVFVRQRRLMGTDDGEGEQEEVLGSNEHDKLKFAFFAFALLPRAEWSETQVRHGVLGYVDFCRADLSSTPVDPAWLRDVSSRGALSCPRSTHTIKRGGDKRDIRHDGARSRRRANSSRRYFFFRGSGYGAHLGVCGQPHMSPAIHRSG